MDPTARSVLPEMAKLASTRCRNGSKRDVSEPAAPSHRSWLRLRLNPGSRSLRNELVIDCVAQPVRPGSFACSKSYVIGLVLMLSSRSLGALAEEVSAPCG